MPPYKKLRSLLRTITPSVHSNAIPASEKNRKPAVIYRESSESRASNFRGSVRVYSVFRVQFQSSTHEEAYNLYREFVNAANSASPKILVENMTSFYDEDRKVHISEATARVF